MTTTTNVINLHNFTVGAPINAAPSKIILPSSVTQVQAHEKTSDRYQFINTGEIVSRFESQGLVLRQATQARSKKYDGFQKHIVRMSMPGQAKVGDTIPEILIIGSHNGTSTHQFRLGLYSMVCSNGLMVGADIGCVKVRHFGTGVQQIVEDALNDLHTQLPFVAKTVEAMQNRVLTIDEMAAFARLALELRGAPNKAIVKGTVDSIQANLLVSRRSEDRAPNLWEVFNRVQENVIRGSTGLRRITSAARDADLNRGLWNIAEGFLQAA